MQIISIDYGAAKIGLALGDTIAKLSEPLAVIKHKSIEDAVVKVSEIIDRECVSKVVLGVSQGKNDEGAKEFGRLLAQRSNIEVVYLDENFTTQFAIDMSIEAGIKQGKRKRMEDAFAAAVILDNYFEMSDI